MLGELGATVMLESVVTPGGVGAGVGVALGVALADPATPAQPVDATTSVRNKAKTRICVDCFTMGYTTPKLQ